MAYFRTEHCDGTVIVTIANPPYNTLHRELLLEGAAMLAGLAGNSPAGGVVLTGEGANFTRGVDTKIIAQLQPAEIPSIVAAVNAYAAALHRLPGALVCAINGHAIGAGGIMALAADWVVAAQGDYKIGLPEARAGLPFPSVPQAILDHWMDPAWRRRLALSSQLLGPEQAIAAGLADEVVPAETVVEIAVERARALTAQPGFAACKRQLRTKANAEIDALLAG